MQTSLKRPLVAEQSQPCPDRDFYTRLPFSCCQPDALCPDRLCCVATHCPWWYFGVNSRKAFGHSQFWTTMLYFIMYAVSWIVALMLGTWTAKVSEDCTARGSASGGACSTTQVWALTGLAYSTLIWRLTMPIFFAYHRGLLRARFGIKGAAWKDLLVSLCCLEFAHCQEARTVREYTREEEFISRVCAQVSKAPKGTATAPEYQLMSQAV